MPQSGADRADRKKGKGVGLGRMQGERRGDSGGARVDRPRAHAVIVPNQFATQPTHAILERKVFEVPGGRIPGIAEKALGEAYVGKRIFLWDSGGSGSGNN